MNDHLQALARAASQASAAGRWDEAEKLWGQVLALAPEHPQALQSLGAHAFRRRDLAAAADFLRRAQQSAPNDPTIPASLAVALRESGDEAGEWQAISRALAIDAYFLPALVARAAFFERKGDTAAAARGYRACLRVVPQEAQWPAGLRDALAHGREVADRYTERLAAVLDEAVAGVAGAGQPVDSQWREAASIMAGRTRPYFSDCNQLHVPRLPALPFHPRASFPWIEALESRTDAIRAELLAILEQDEGFTPYVAHKPGQPVNQWKELDHSPRWNAYHLWQHGKPVEEHLARCPVTAKALQAVDGAAIDGMGPNAMFSLLAPHTHIPPHNGETNARLVAHLPLIVPDGCSFRVGFEHRTWKEGEVMVFDDSIEHEARNDSDQLRVVLIFDVWNPLLDATGREMVNRMTIASREYRGD